MLVLRPETPQLKLPTNIQCVLEMSFLFGHTPSYFVEFPKNLFFLARGTEVHLTTVDHGQCSIGFLLHINVSPLKCYKSPFSTHLLNKTCACISAIRKETTSPSVSIWFAKLN